MMNRTSPDAIDTRIVFRVYAILAWIAGFCVLAWGQGWLGTDLPGIPYGLAIPIRLAGAVIMGAGCLASALFHVEDPRARHRALLWFALGHTIVLQAIFIQITGPWENPGPGVQVLVSALMTTVFLFVYFWRTGDGYSAIKRADLTTLLSRGDDAPPIEHLRSEYEQRIREAAGQEERNRLARDLHDSIKQQIFVIQTAAATAEARMATDRSGTEQAVAQVRSAAREAMIELEVMLDQLRAAPLENVGLVEALRKQCDALGFRTGASVTFTPDALPPSDTLPPGAQQAAFRIVQEALANVARHARASNVRVAIGSNDFGGLRLSIEDDGSGFDQDAPARGMGLSNMRTRAAEVGGSVTVDSHGGGTAVRLAIPASARDADWSEYRWRLVSWFMATVMFGAAVLFDVLHPPRAERLVATVPMLLVAVVVFLRSWVAYRRAKKRSHAAPWEEHVSHS